MNNANNNDDDEVSTSSVRTTRSGRRVVTSHATAAVVRTTTAAAPNMKDKKKATAAKKRKDAPVVTPTAGSKRVATQAAAAASRKGVSPRVLLPPAADLKKGDVIELLCGDAKRRQYNGKPALVEEYPDDSCWMTVKVLDFESQPVLQWRKGLHGGKTIHPLDLLDDDLMVRIFKFLGGGEKPHHNLRNSSSVEKKNPVVWDELSDPTVQQEGPLPDTLWVKDAARIHAQLASVCRKWRQLVCGSGNLPDVLGLLDANLEALLPTNRVIPCIKWIVRNKVKLGTLKVRTGLADIALLKWILRECQTGELTVVKACVNRIVRRGGLPSSQHSPWIMSACESHVAPVDLCEAPNWNSPLSQQAQYLSVPYEEGLSQRHFYEFLAERCPNTVDLNVSLDITCGEPATSYLSKKLFSLPSVSTLKLSLGMAHPETAVDPGGIDGMLVSRAIENLPGLHKLVLATRREPEFVNARFHVSSEELRVLDVEGLCKLVWISCDCPQLEKVLFVNSLYGNGSAPMAPYAAGKDIVGQRHSDGRVSYLAREVPLIGMCVPGTCIISCDSEFPGNRDDWERQRQHCQVATFITFQDDGEW